MDENRARRVADSLRDRGIDAHLETSGIDVFGVRVVLTGGREAIWGNEGTTALEAVVLLDGDLVGFIPEIPGSAAFDEAQVIDAIARADYDDPVGRELPEAPPPAPPLAREGGLFRRFRGGFRYDSELCPAGQVAARAKSIRSTDLPRPTRTVATISGGNRPCSTTPGVDDRRAASSAGSSTGPW
jgi:hypothetical protein